MNIVNGNLMVFLDLISVYFQCGKEDVLTAWGYFYMNLTYSTDNLAEMLHILFIHKCREVN